MTNHDMTDPDRPRGIDPESDWINRTRSLADVWGIKLRFKRSATPKLVELRDKAEVERQARLKRVGVPGDGK